MPTVKVYPGATNATHEISLSDGFEKWGLKLDNGPRGIQEIPQTPSTLLINNQAKKFGDYDPSMSHIQQRTWHGGRGQEDFVDDESKFFDSMNAWTMTPDRLLPGPQWSFATNIRTVDENLPGSVLWKELRGAQRYVATTFTAAANNTADKAYLWIRRIGSPGTLTFELRANSAGDPGSVLQTVTKTTTDITDVVSLWQVFDWSSTESLTASTVYWVVIYGASGDNPANHWEVGVQDSVSTGVDISSAGSSWATANYKLYFRVVGADVNRKWHFFILEGGLYAVDQKASGAASVLFINGDRGTATSGAATSITDSNKTWGTTRFVGARVKIVSGTGVGQNRSIVSHTDTALTVATWDLNPDNTSKYVIYDTDYWTSVGTPGLGAVTGRPAVGSNVAYFPQGTVTTRRMRVNASSHDFADDATDDSDLFYTFYDAVDGAQIWRAVNGTTMSVARSVVKAWGTNLTFGTAITVGNINSKITGMLDYNGQLWVFKEDSLWTISNDRASRVNVGLDAMPDDNNGIAPVAHNLFLYFPWSHSVERFYSGTLDDVGPWKGAGLPSGRTGPVSSMEPAIAWIFEGVNGGSSNTSSILCDDGRGLHEVFRAWEAGQRVQSVKWQPQDDARPKLWVSVGGDIVRLKFPLNTLNPLRDSTFPYQHEAVLITSSIDMGAARLPKFIKEITLTTENLASGTECRIEYQIDENIGTSSWVSAGQVNHSPSETLGVNVGGITRIRFRLRLLTKTSTLPPVVIASIAEGFARTPVKYQYNLKIKVADLQRNRIGGVDNDPDKFTFWLKNAARQAKRIRMRSIWEQLDDKFVVVEPPTILRQFTNAILNWWGGTMLVTVREA